MIRKTLLLVTLAILWAGAARPAWATDIAQGRDCATALTVQPGVLQNGVLAGPGDRAVYRLVLEKRSILNVTADFGNIEVRHVELLDSTCNPIQFRGFGNSVISIPSPLWTLAPGVYFIRFAGTPSPLLGLPFTFEVNVTPHFGHDCATAEPLSALGPKEGELLYPEDLEVFRVDLGAPGKIHAWTSGPREGTDEPYLDLLMADCATPVETQYSSDALGVFSVTLNPGTYYLSIRPEPHTLGKYTLYVEFSRDAQIYDPFWYVPLN